MADLNEARIARLEAQLGRQRAMLTIAGLAAAGIALAAFAVPAPKTIEAQAIRIVDASGKPRILIGAPPPADGRARKDAQTASIVVLGADGKDRLILGESPDPVINGKTYPRIAAAYGLILHNKDGVERGGMAYLDNGRGVIALDRPGADAVALVTNEQTGFAGLTVNYAASLGKYVEGIRIGTKGDDAFLSLQDRAEGERARLSASGSAAPTLVTRAAGAPPAP